MTRLPESSSGDEDHPEVPKAECSSVDYHPHQRHEVDRQCRLPGTTREKYKTPESSSTREIQSVAAFFKSYG